jgi:phospholipase/carboxylesterase
MSKHVFQGIELLPELAKPRQLFILLHGLGSEPSDLVPLAHRLRVAYPDAAFLIPDGAMPFDGGGTGRQWYSIKGMTEENRHERIAAGLPALHSLVRQAQDRLRILPTDTALVGFSQGANMALELSAIHDGIVGRILAFSGRYSKLPEKAPELTTLHLLHGEDDYVISVDHTRVAYDRLSALQGDATIDIASGVGHELHPVLVERAISRLQTCVPLRSWKRAMGDAE